MEQVNAQDPSESLMEKLLLAVSIKPGEPEHSGASSNWDLDSALSLACAMFPNFLELIKGKSVLDFGCGWGWQSVALYKKAGASRVVGVDTFPEWLAKCHVLAKQFNVENDIEFTEKIQDEHKGQFDVVLSQSSFEHFPDPVRTLNEMRSALKPDGRLLITYHAPWYSPYGGHIEFFTRLPWAHLIFPEPTVMKVRSRYRSDGATRYEEIATGLNRMSIAKFDRIIADSGMRVLYRHNRCIRGLPVNHIPVLKELLGSMVTAILSPAK